MKHIFNNSINWNVQNVILDSPNVTRINITIDLIIIPFLRNIFVCVYKFNKY